MTIVRMWGIAVQIACPAGTGLGNGFVRGLIYSLPNPSPISFSNSARCLINPANVDRNHLPFVWRSVGRGSRAYSRVGMLLSRRLARRCHAVAYLSGRPDRLARQGSRSCPSGAARDATCEITSNVRGWRRYADLDEVIDLGALPMMVGPSAPRSMLTFEPISTSRE